MTLYRDDQIAGLALTAELAAEIVAGCNAAEPAELSIEWPDPSAPSR